MRIALLLLPLALGCSALNSPDMHVPAPVEAAEFCVLYAEIICDAVIDCCSTSAVDRPSCLDLMGVFCSNAFGPSFSDQRTGYDAQEAAVQLAIGRQRADACDVNMIAWYSRTDGVASVMRGTVAEAGSCDPLFTEVWDPPESRVVDVPRFYSCDEGLACTITSSAPLRWGCRPLGAMGDSCIGLADCQVELGCQAVGPSGQCQARSPAGAACTIGPQCESYLCRGDRCQPNETADQVFCGLLDG